MQTSEQSLASRASSTRLLNLFARPATWSTLRLIGLAAVLVSSQLLSETAFAAQADGASQQAAEPNSLSSLSKQDLLIEPTQDPDNKAAYYSIVRESALSGADNARPEMGIEACNRLIELGEKPFFALGLSHYRLEHWGESLDAFITSLLEWRKPGECQDRTLHESDVKFLYAYMTDCLVQSGCDDIAVEVIRELSPQDDQLDLIRFNIGKMLDVEAWESIVAMAEIGLPIAPPKSTTAKELLFQMAFAQAYSNQFEASEKIAEAAQAIQSDNEGLTAKCNNLPILIAAKKKQIAESSTPLRGLSDSELSTQIEKLRNAEPIDQPALLGSFLENISRIRNSGLAERTKNLTALVVVNDALKELPESTALATQKLELLFMISKYKEIEALLAEPRKPAFKKVSSVWPAIVQAKQLSESEDSAKQQEAVKLAQQAFAEDPANPISRLALIDTYGTAGEVEKLLPFAKQGFDANSWQSVAMVADFNEFSGKPVDALMLNSYASKMPQANKPMLAWKRAELLQKIGLNSSALALYSDAFDNGFSANGMRESAIKLCLEEHKFDDALRYCEQEIALAEKEADESESKFDLLPTYLLLAKCHLNRGEIRKVEDALVKIDNVKEISKDNAETRDEIKRRLQAASQDKAALMAMSHGKAGLLTSQMSPAAKGIVDLKLLQRQIDQINSRHPWLSRQTWAGHHLDEKWDSRKRSIEIPVKNDEGSQIVTVVVNRSRDGKLLSLDIETENSTISTANCIGIDSSIIKPAKEFFEKLAARDFKGSHDVGANFGNDGAFIPLDKFTELFSKMTPMLKEIETIDFKEATIASLHDTEGEPEAAVYLWASMKDGGVLPMQCRFDLSDSEPRFTIFTMGDSVNAQFHSTDQQNAERFVAAFASGESEQIANLMPESNRHLIDDHPLFSIFQKQFLAIAGPSKGIKAASFTGRTKMGDGDVLSKTNFIAEFANAEIPMELEYYFDELLSFTLSLDEYSAWQGSPAVKELLTANAKRDLTNYITASPESTKEMLVDYGGFSNITQELLEKEKQQFASWLDEFQELKVMSAEFRDGRWEFFFRVVGSKGQGRAKIFYTIDGFNLELFSFAVKSESSFAPQPETTETPAK